METDEDYDLWLAGWLRKALAPLLDAAGADADGAPCNCPEGLRLGGVDWPSRPLALKLSGIWLLLAMHADFASEKQHPPSPFERFAHLLREALTRAHRGDVLGARQRLAAALQEIESLPRL